MQQHGEDSDSSMPTTGPEADLRYTELVLCRLRYVVAGLAATMAAVLQPSWLPVALGLSAASVGVSLYTRAVLRRSRSLPELRQLGRRVLGFDAAVAITTYVLYLNDPQAIPVAFLPLLVFELAARYPRHGVVIGLAVFVTGLAVRVAFQAWGIPNGAIRPPLLLVWLMLGALLLVLCRELTVRDQLRIAARQERERIAASFRTVISEILSRSGVPPQAASSTDVLEAVHRICEERSNEYSSLAARIADVLVPSAREFGLTRREREVVGLLAMGYSYQHIARALFVSASTVRNHVHHVRTKLGLSSQDDVVAFARQQGLVPPLPPTAATAGAEGAPHRPR
jgi:DNA-binding CsgD family transcriptional regulator